MHAEAVWSDTGGVPSFTWSTVRHGTTTVVGLRGELDLASGRRLCDAARFNGWCATAGTVLFNLSRVSFVDCAGLAALLFAQDQLRSTGKRVALIQPAPAVSRLLRHLGMEGEISTNRNVRTAQPVHPSLGGRGHWVAADSGGTAGNGSPGAGRHPSAPGRTGGIPGRR